MRPQPRYQKGDKIGGRYQVHQALMGGMGEVYLCLDLEEMVPLALKTFQQRYQSQALRKAFEQEVATWVALEKHPNIVRCFHMNILDNQPFMVLEWIAGEEGKGADLRGWLRRGPLDLKTALEITIDVVRGLIHAQEKQPGLVHRDLKPENILVAQGGLAKITDFGLAQIVETARLKVESDGEGRQSMTGKGGIAGTPAYMAPEQWRGEALDERTDIYAIGCIMYEMLTDGSPFQADFSPNTPQQFQQWLRTMQMKHENDSPPDLPTDIPEAIGEVVWGCLAKELEARPTTLTGLWERLRGVYEQQFDQVPPIRPPGTAFSISDYNNRGVTYDSLQQYEAALADYQQAIKLDPQFAAAYTNRANTYHAQQQYEAALADYQRAIELDPQFAAAYYNRGNLYQKLGQVDRALADYNRAIELDPQFAAAYSNRGNLYQKLGQVDRALANYNRAIELDPQGATVFSNRGSLYQELGQADEALADYNRAIELDPQFAAAYSNRGVLYEQLGQDKQALADYQQAIELDPQDVKAYSNRGIIYRGLGQTDKSLADFNRAIELDPQFTTAYYNRGSLYQELGRADKALADFNRAIEFDPQYTTAYLNRGNTHNDLGQADKALVDYNRAIELDPQGAVAYFNRGNTYRDLGQVDKALADYNRAIELDPQFTTAYVGIGALLGNLGQLQEALPYFEKAAQLNDPTGAQYAAQVRQMLGESAPAPQPDPTQAAFAAFQQAASPEAMRQVVTQFPFMAQADFIAAIEQAIVQQVPPEHRPHFEQCLGWLKQIAQEQNQ